MIDERPIAKTKVHHRMRSIFSLLVSILVFSSLLFAVLSIVYHIISIPGVDVVSLSAIRDAALILLVAFLCYLLEGVQQAANSASQIDKDVIDVEARNESISRRIVSAIDGYDRLSAARQIFSIAFIFLTKNLFDSLVPAEEYTGTHEFWSFIAPYLQNTSLKFIAATMVVAFFLQLLPKRNAKLDPVGYLSGFRGYVAFLLEKVGSLGLDAPVRISSSLVLGLVGSSPKKKDYPLSQRRVLEELGKRNGFYVERLILKFIVDGENISVEERATYKVSKKKVNPRRYISSITHRITLSGIWTYGKPRSFVGDEEVTAHKVTVLARRESRFQFFDTLNDNGDTDDSDLLADDDKDSEEINLDSPATSNEDYTQVLVEAKFPKQLDRLADCNSTIYVNSKLHMVEPEDELQQGFRTRKFKFSISVPIENLDVIVTTTGGENPKDAKLLVNDVFDWKESSIDNYEILESDELSYGESHGILMRQSLPFVGNRLLLRVDV